MFWAALPPLGNLNFWPLAWLAPVPWMWLVRRSKLSGRRPYAALFLANLLFWLATLYWLLLPHWAGVFGWLALSLYLAVYLPLYVALVRVAVHRYRISILLAAPIVWTGLELARNHLFTGFPLVSLGHTQHPWLAIIQFSDITGAYGVSFLIVLVAACVVRMWPSEVAPRAFWPALPAVLALSAALGYGSYQLGHASRSGDSPLPPSPKVALIQGSIDTVFNVDARDFKKQLYEEHLQLTLGALAQDPTVDVVIWPESMYHSAYTQMTPDAHLSEAMRDFYKKEHGEEMTEAESRRRIEIVAFQSQAELAEMMRSIDKPVLLGIDVEVYGAGTLDRYNGSFLVAPDGTVEQTYYKMHAVLFGEYIPFGEALPWLYSFSPLGAGLQEGTAPAAFEINGVRYAPNICFESVVPHLVRGQVAALRAAGKDPHVLVTQTNDGWFYGSSALDLHLICDVFRAVECRRPLVTAANTGFSAVIDADGRILAKGPRRQRAVLIEPVPLDGRDSFYVRQGDLFAGACGWATGLLLVGCLAGVARRRFAGGSVDATAIT